MTNLNEADRQLWAHYCATHPEFDARLTMAALGMDGKLQDEVLTESLLVIESLAQVYCQRCGRVTCVCGELREN